MFAPSKPPKRMRLLGAAHINRFVSAEDLDGPIVPVLVSTSGPVKRKRMANKSIDAMQQ